MSKYWFQKESAKLKKRTNSQLIAEIKKFIIETRIFLKLK